MGWEGVWGGVFGMPVNVLILDQHSGYIGGYTGIHFAIIHWTIQSWFV